MDKDAGGPKATAEPSQGFPSPVIFVLEEIGSRLHSTNPVPLLAVGPGAESFHQAQAITDVAGGIMRVLEA